MSAIVSMNHAIATHNAGGQSDGGCAAAAAAPPPNISSAAQISNNDNNNDHSISTEVVVKEKHEPHTLSPNTKTTDSDQQENVNTSSSEMHPCFSFKKQPIPSRVSCHSAISSFIEPDHSLTLSNTSGGSNSKKNSNGNNEPITTDQDYQATYDEQIRAPRMSTLSKTNSAIKIAKHEPLGDCDYLHRNSNDSSSNNMNNDQFSDSSRNTSATSNTSMDLGPLWKQQLSQQKLNLQNIHHQQQQQQQQFQQQAGLEKAYCPAAYDLSQPLRRYSSPSVHSTSLSSGQDQTQIINEKNTQALGEIATKALYNIQTSQAALNRKDPRERICADGPIRQIDEPKTPNYVPAVLRPPNYHSSSASAIATTSSSTITGHRLSFSSLTDMEDFGVSATSSTSPTSKNGGANNHGKFFELPRNHWVPNNERSSCQLCHSKFSLINRKHHCRKCGDIFCFNCCYIRASLNFKLNFDSINGVPVKVCNSCGIEYNQYIRKNFVTPQYSHNHRSADKQNGGGDKMMMEDSNKNDSELLDKERKNSTQVPVDWNWSSF